VILTVTANPMIEHTVGVDVNRVGGRHRVRAPLAQVTGKGLNVSRALVALGCPNAAVVAAEGALAPVLSRMLGDEGIEHRLAATGSCVRAGFAVVDAAGVATTYYGKGEAGAEELERGLLEAVGAAVEELRPRAAVLAGSLPEGAGTDLYASLARALRRAGVPVVLDAVGPALVAAMSEGAEVVKVNREEFRATFGRAPRSEGDYAAALRDLRDTHGARVAAVTAGSGAAFFLVGDTVYRAIPPEVHVRNTVGSGDSLLAGWLAARYEGLASDEAVRTAMAAGAANAEQLAVAAVDAGRVRELTPKVVLTEV